MNSNGNIIVSNGNNNTPGDGGQVLQEDTILRAIAISSLQQLPPQAGSGGGPTTIITASDRREAFRILEHVRTAYERRIALAVRWLLHDATGASGSIGNGGGRGAMIESWTTDEAAATTIVTARTLLATEIIRTFLEKGFYGKCSEQERFELRKAVIRAVHNMIVTSSTAATTATTTASTTNGGAGGNGNAMTEHRILAKKLAALLEGFVVRDFPQQWPTFTAEVFAPIRNGGLWYDEQDVAAANSDPSIFLSYCWLGVSVCLECLRLLAEDCTDSDFNAKISTSRRNDVLAGCNEVAGEFVPRIFALLERQTSALQLDYMVRMHQMHVTLIREGRTTQRMTADENQVYHGTRRQMEGCARVVADALITVQKFCTSMPLHWIVGGGGGGDSATTSNPPQQSSLFAGVDFIPALLYLLREPTGGIQILAAECLEHLASRKLEYSLWMRFIEQVPGAVQQANEYYAQSAWEYDRAQQQASGNTATSSSSPEDAWMLMLDFHRPLARMLSQLLASHHVGHITSDNSNGGQRGSILAGVGPRFEQFSNFLRLFTDLLGHPSGRIASEQLNTWIAMWRDPQIQKSRILQPYLERVLSRYMDHFVRVRWEEDVLDAGESSLLSVVYQESFDDEEDYRSWQADIRSRSSLLFKLAANVEPATVSNLLQTKMEWLLVHHGAGAPLDHLDPTNRQLTSTSQAVLLFEGMQQPMDNILAGIPSWAMQQQQQEADKSNNNGKNGFQSNGGNGHSGNTAANNNINNNSRAVMRQQTIASLSQLANELVAWDPVYVWLKFRRASLLEGLKHVWKYIPTTLLPAVDSLLRYLGLPDEWNNNTSTANNTNSNNASAALSITNGDDGSSGDNNRMSGEMVGLKKKSGVTLISVSKRVPHHLVPWLSKLSEVTASLLHPQNGSQLIPLNQMHLYEFLTCVATAVPDSAERSNFIANVLRGAVETLESSREIQQMISSPDALLLAMGVTQQPQEPFNPQLLTDPDHVKTISSQYHSLFAALHKLLSVGKRCNEAVRKQPSLLLGTGQSVPTTATTATASGTAAAAGMDGAFAYPPDEGPLSISDLAVHDPFVPLWPRILPPILNVYEAITSVWRPEHQAALLQNPYQRYVYAISDDEAYMSKTQDKKAGGGGGGVFGVGGTAGSVVAGVSRRDVNLVPKWSGWFNELRNTCFQMMGLLATSRVLFAPELAPLYPRLVSVLVNPAALKCMEHRHIILFLKQVMELMVISCPATLYATHLEPILSPVMEHMRYRLEKTWLPILGDATTNGSTNQANNNTKALTSGDAQHGAMMAVQFAAAGGGNDSTTDGWFCWYYAHCGLFVGDLESVIAEAAVEKYRVELSRSFSDFLQTALALKGDWALVLANVAKEEQAAKRNDATKLVKGPGNRVVGDDNGTNAVQLNADGTVKGARQAELDARKLLRINGLCHFLLLEHERLAASVSLAVVQCLRYPDAYTCRRMTKVCHRVLETVSWSPQYTRLLGEVLFTQAIKNIVTEPKWMVGIEWDMINVVRDVYCRLVLGQVLQPGGQGLAQQQATAASAAAPPGQQRAEQEQQYYEQAKTVDRPLAGGGILVQPSALPRNVLANLPGAGGAPAVERLERAMKQKRSAKDQKDVLRDLLRTAADCIQASGCGVLDATTTTTAASGGVFDRAVKEESLLHCKSKNGSCYAVPDLPEKLVTQSRVMKEAARAREQEPMGMASAIFQNS